MINKNLLVLFVVMFLTRSVALGQETTAKQSKPANDVSTGKVATTKKINRKKASPVKEATVEMPPLGDRLNEQRLAIRSGEQREASQPYLIEEVSVNGIYKSVEGYGAFLKAVNGRLFFAYKGMLFYDGEVLQIDADQVIFQQNLPNGKKKQIIKAYDPSALRSTALEKEEKTKQDATKKKKKSEEKNEDAGTKDE